MAKGRELYAAYQERLRTLNACDFGRPAVPPPSASCANNPDVLADYHRRFRYILVDEYQDTNTAQYMWLRLLAQRPARPTPSLRDDPPHQGEGERPSAEERTAGPQGRPAVAPDGAAPPATRAGAQGTRGGGASRDEAATA